MAEGNGGPAFRPRSGRDLFMVPQSDRLNDQFRLIDTLVLSMTDSWAYLPPRAKHILWLKLASCDRNFLEQCGMPMENGILLHWSMWPDDLGDYAQAVSLRSSRQQLEYLEPKNVAMASAIRQAEMAENTSRLQIQLAQLLLRLQNGGADTTELAKLFSKDKFDKESIKMVLQSAEQAMFEAREEARQQQHTPSIPTQANAPMDRGNCSECGCECEYVTGEDEHGKYVIDVCHDCYEKLVQQNPVYDEGDIEGLIQGIDDGPMQEDELLNLADAYEEEEGEPFAFAEMEELRTNLTLAEMMEAEGVWVDSTDGPIWVPENEVDEVIGEDSEE